MIGKVAAEASEKARVKAIDKTSTHADGILPLARKWARSVHQLLVVGLNRAGDDITVLVRVHLADVIQGSVRLVAVAGAKLGEHHLTDGCDGEAKNFLLDFVSDGKRVSSRAGGTKTRGLKLDWPVLEGVIEDIGLDLLRGKGSEVPRAVERCQSVGGADPIGHLTSCLRQLDEVLDSERRGARVSNGDEVDEVGRELDADKLDILAARGIGAIDHRQENRWVCRGSRVVDLVAPGIMKAQNFKDSEIAPAVVEVPKPVVDDVFDRCTQVQLVPEGIKLNTEVNVLRQKGGLVDVEGMGSLVRRHIAVDDGI